MQKRTTWNLFMPLLAVQAILATGCAFKVNKETPSASPPGPNQGNPTEAQDPASSPDDSTHPVGSSGNSGTASLESPSSYPSIRKNILLPKCITCHNGPSAPHGLDLSTYKSIVESAAFPPLVVTGDPENSSLYTASASGRMPKGMAKLSDEELRALYDWIKKGAKEAEDTSPPNQPTPQPVPTPPSEPGDEPGEGEDGEPRPTGTPGNPPNPSPVPGPSEPCDLVKGPNEPGFLPCT